MQRRSRSQSEGFDMTESKRDFRSEKEEGAERTCRSFNRRWRRTFYFSGSRSVALWGGLDPPPGKLPIAASERVEFLHDQDGPFVNDQIACCDLMRQIRGGTRLMPEVAELAFLGRFSDSARADAGVLFNLMRSILISFFGFQG